MIIIGMPYVYDDGKYAYLKAKDDICLAVYCHRTNILKDKNK